MNFDNSNSGSNSRVNKIVAKHKKGEKKRCPPFSGTLFMKSLLRLFMVSMYNTRQPMMTSPESQFLREQHIKRTRSMVREVLGTQEPVLRLRSEVSVVASSGASVINPVVNGDLSGIHDWAAWASVFDEYQIQKIKLYLVQYQQPSAVLLGTNDTSCTPVCFCVDYDESGALASVNAAIAYDTFKVWFASRTNPKVFTMTAHPQGQPDKAWVTTASPVTSLWFKGYGFANSAIASSTLAAGFLEFDVKFRQVDA